VERTVAVAPVGPVPRANFVIPANVYVPPIVPTWNVATMVVVEAVATAPTISSAVITASASMKTAHPNVPPKNAVTTNVGGAVAVVLREKSAPSLDIAIRSPANPTATGKSAVTMAVVVRADNVQARRAVVPMGNVFRSVVSPIAREKTVVAMAAAGTVAPARPPLPVHRTRSVSTPSDAPTDSETGSPISTIGPQ